jgi:hypothetical protein
MYNVIVILPQLFKGEILHIALFSNRQNCIAKTAHKKLLSSIPSCSITDRELN